MIPIALAAVALFSLGPFQAEAVQALGSKQKKTINQPTVQRSNEINPSLNHKPAGQFNANVVILSSVRLSNWNQTRTSLIGLTGQMKVSTPKKKVITNVMRKLSESNELMKKVAELQKNPLKNRPALMKAAAELRKYENQIKGLQRKLGSPLLPWDNKLKSAGEDAQLANIELQNMLQKQQQTIQMLSNATKVLHDTALAVIRKIG